VEDEEEEATTIDVAEDPGFCSNEDIYIKIKIIVFKS
jgi:hypothetical protein